MARPLQASSILNVVIHRSSNQLSKPTKPSKPSNSSKSSKPTMPSKPASPASPASPANSQPADPAAFRRPLQASSVFDYVVPFPFQQAHQAEQTSVRRIPSRDFGCPKDGFFDTIFLLVFFVCSEIRRANWRARVEIISKVSTSNESHRE
jgi:hypothetical protein